jgi:putative chitinase
MITTSDLLAIARRSSGNAVTQSLAAAFNKHAPSYEVTRKIRIAQFLANVCHETGGFTTLEESLNYSGDRLLKTFGRHRISEADAKRYGRGPGQAADQRAIANILYGGDWGRKNLGNTEPNDGWNFRGSGPGQVTGRTNFAAAAKETGLPLVENPDLMRDPETGMVAALILWQKWGLNQLADAGQTDAIRKRWNGGTLGLEEVRSAYSRGMALDLSVRPGEPGPPLAYSPSLIRRGDKGDAVKTLQIALGVAPDGDFGPATERAVLAFQKEHGLTADGIVGKSTGKMLGLPYWN